MDTLTAVKLAVGLFFLGNFWKVIPPAYHLRCGALLLWHLFGVLFLGTGFQRPSDVVTSSHIVLLSDLDYNLHQNNSNYALEMDIARIPMFVRLVAGRRPWLLPLWSKGWRIASGAVSTYFFTEMRLGQVYTISTQVAGVDRKWVYMMGVFRGAAGETFAVSITRIVFKQGRRTLQPREVMAELGYAAADIEALEELGAPALPPEGAPAAQAMRALGPVVSCVGDTLRAAVGGAGSSSSSSGGASPMSPRVAGGAAAAAVAAVAAAGAGGSKKGAAEGKDH